MNVGQLIRILQKFPKRMGVAVDVDLEDDFQQFELGPENIVRTATEGDGDYISIIVASDWRDQ